MEVLYALTLLCAANMGCWNPIDLIQFRFLSPPGLTTFSFPRARVALMTFPRVLVHRLFCGFLSIHPSESAMHRSDANSVLATVVAPLSMPPLYSLRPPLVAPLFVMPSYTRHPTIVIP